jgi:hypothetical protein
MVLPSSWFESSVLGSIRPSSFLLPFRQGEKLGVPTDEEKISRQKWGASCTSMFIVALFTIAKLWKQPRCPSTDEWIKTMWYLYTMEYYAAMKKNEMLSFAGKWMELENIILSEVSLAKTKNRVFSLICGH